MFGGKIHNIGSAVSDSFHGDGVIHKRWLREALHKERDFYRIYPFAIHKTLATTP